MDPDGAVWAVQADEAAGRPPQEQGVARRSMLRGVGAGALATGAGGILAACSSGIKGSQTASSNGTITLGYISPFTGSLAGFASGDRFEGWKPELATVAKVLLFPADTVALGPLVNNIATDSWWGPYMPNQSSQDRQRAGSLVSAFQEQTGKERLQGIGSTYSLFEVAKEAFTAASDPHDRQEVANALHNVSCKGMCGPLDFSGGPAPGVAIIKPVGVQWKQSSGKFPLEMRVVDNSLNTAVPIQADLQATN